MPRTLNTSQRAALRALVDKGSLTSGQCREVEAALAGEASAGLRRRLPEVLCYLGGALLLGGSLLLIEPLEPFWRDLAPVWRAVILAAVSVLLIAAGVVAAPGRAGLRPARSASLTARQRLATVLFVFAAQVAAFATGEVTVSSTWFALTGLVVAMAGYLVLSSVLGLVVTAAFSAGLVTVILDDGPRDIWPASGLVAIGLAWGLLAATGVVRQRIAGYAAAVAISYLGAAQVHDPLALMYGLMFAIAVVCLAGYARDRSPILLVAGIGGLAVAVCVMTADLTSGVATPAIVLIAGAVLVLASAAALYRKRDVGHSPQEPGERVIG